MGVSERVLVCTRPASYSSAEKVHPAAHCLSSPPFVLSTEPPDPPQDVKSLDIGSRKIRLSWTAPYTGNSVIVKYIVQYRTHEGKPDILIGQKPIMIRVPASFQRVDIIRMIGGTRDNPH